MLISNKRQNLFSGFKFERRALKIEILLYQFFRIICTWAFNFYKFTNFI